MFLLYNFFMVAVLLLLAMMANPATTATATPTTPSDMSTNNSSGDGTIRAAQARHNWIFGAYVLLLGLTVVGTYLVWSSGNKVQDAVQADANARIEEAKNNAAQANALAKGFEKDNLVLKGQVADLQTDANNAKAAQQKVEIQLAEQQERAAIAEKTLLQLRESLKDRVITPDQEKILVEALKGAPSGPVEIWWTASDTDSYGLALQMVRIFKEAGWPPATERFATGGSGFGFFLVVRDHMNAPAHAVSIQKAYKLVGIDMSGFSKPEVPEGAVQIFIGHKNPTP